MFVSQHFKYVDKTDYGLKKRVEAVFNCRKAPASKGGERLGKKHMEHNFATPAMEVDPETFVSFCSYASKKEDSNHFLGR